MVSFEVLEWKAMAGIVITASHNPPEYNGYKVYWKNGGQIIAPQDQGIIAEVRQVTDMASIARIPFENALPGGNHSRTRGRFGRSLSGGLGKTGAGRSCAKQTIGSDLHPLAWHGHTLRSSSFEKTGFPTIETNRSAMRTRQQFFHGTLPQSRRCSGFLKWQGPPPHPKMN